MREDLGIFEFGFNRVRIYAVDGLGGAFRVLPKKKDEVPYIEIGMDATADNEIDILNVFLHEAFEFLSTKYLVRYELADRMATGHDRYTFIFNHYQFSELMFSLADGIISAYPTVKRYWRRHLRSKEKQENKEK